MSVRGLKAFDTYYSSVFGTRWENLKAALQAPVRQVARLNKFADADHLAKKFPATKRESWRDCEWVELVSPLEPSQDSKGVFDFYRMDLASVFPALVLNVQSGERVLDMCAAPGGKTLILAERIGDGELIANEISDNRRSRLSRVIREYVPKDLAESVKVFGHDATRWCLHEKDAYEKVLLDAPCSGERHLLEDASEMKTWSESRSKNLAVRQYSLLASAIQTVKPGGRVVYSTCSLSVRENDDVIARLLKRRAGEARVVNEPAPLGEASEHGWMILPDQTGFGPIYYSVLERT